MGPRPNGRGKSSSGNMPLLYALLQWGRGQTAAERAQAEQAGAPRYYGFNGAAAKRPRKVHQGQYGLQKLLASMGPRPNGRGKLSRPWSLAVIRPASMGPRPNGRGKLFPQIHHPCQIPCFNGAAAKRPRKGGPPAGRNVQGKASMGPRPNGRGKAVYVRVAARRPLASMGPRPNGRGKLPRSALRFPANMPLQWGRGQTAAER